MAQYLISVLWYFRNDIFQSTGDTINCDVAITILTTIQGVNQWWH